jgi:hypothetical protein
MFFANIHKGPSIAIKGDIDATSAVGCLQFVGCPSDISGTVSAGIIDSIERVGGRWFIADALKKILKIAFPFLAYGYAPSAVIRPMGVVRIGASLNHILPSFVNRRSGHSVSLVGGTGHFFLKASTRLRSAILEGSAAASDGFTAFANAVPVTMAIFTLMRVSNNSKSSEPLSNQVY